MAHHITQTLGQGAMQLIPHLTGMQQTPGQPAPPPPQPALQKPAPTQTGNPTQTATPGYTISKLTDIQAQIKLLLNKHQVPTEDQFYSWMQTHAVPGGLVFWSALGGPALSSREAAIEYAKYYNKQLLRPLMQTFDSGYPDDMIFNTWTNMDYPTRQAMVDLTWSRSSRAFASLVRGRAVVVLKGNPMLGAKFPHDKDCWAKDEWVVLTSPKSFCTEIVRVDADNWQPDPGAGGRLKGKVIWTREMGLLNPPVDVPI